MNLSELAQTLPNGFHDAVISGMDVHEAAETATLYIRLLISLPPEESGVEIVEYKPAEIRLNGGVIVESSRPLLRDFGEEYDTQGCVPDDKQWPRLATLDKDSRHSAYSFFVIDWNAFIHTIASKAELFWQ
jgi:hypothetical protein